MKVLGSRAPGRSPIVTCLFAFVGALTLTSVLQAADDPTAPALPPEPKPAPAPAPAPVQTPVHPSAEFIDPVLPGASPQAEKSAEERRQALAYAIKCKLLEAKKAYQEKQYQVVINIARNILTADPRCVAAAEWLRLAQGRLLDADEAVIEIASERRERERLMELGEHSVPPPPRLPTIRPHFPRRDEESETARRKKIEEKLEQPLTADFLKADLESVLNTLFILTGVNIIADQAALEGKSVTLHVQDVPLREVLNFIVRNNDGIQFSITADAVWITTMDADKLKQIMYPRVYPIHFGLVSTQSGGGMSSGGGGGGGTGGRGGGTGRANAGRGGKQGAQNQEPSYLEQVLKWMKDNKDPQVFPDGSDYLIDRQSNQIIVYTTPSGHQKLKEFLDTFDQPAIQVLIKARFLDIEAENEKAIGINLDSVKNAQNIGAPTGTPGNPVKPSTYGVIRDPAQLFNFVGGTPAVNIPGNLGPGSIFSITGARTNPLFQATLSLLLNSRHTKILSEPQILAINNKEAIIDITTHFSYITDLRPVTTNTLGGNGTLAQNVSAFVPEFDEENIGFTLVVTPSVGRDLKTINMHLNPIIDQLASGQQITQFQQFNITQGSQNTAPPAVQRPTIDQTSLETDVVLEDNGYVIIGGLLRNRQEIRQRKVPGLSRIPYLGELFKSTRTNTMKSNLMIIVEAQIITPQGRTYFKDNTIDDADPREGGVNRAPGQVSDATRVDTNPGVIVRRQPAPKSAPVIEPDAPLATGESPAGNATIARLRMERLRQANLRRQENLSQALPAAGTAAPRWTLGEEEKPPEQANVTPRAEVVVPPK